MIQYDDAKYDIRYDATNTSKMLQTHYSNCITKLEFALTHTTVKPELLLHKTADKFCWNPQDGFFFSETCARSN